MRMVKCWPKAALSLSFAAVCYTMQQGDLYALQPCQTARAALHCRFSQWPEDALMSVARKFLAGTDLGGEEVREAVATM